MASVLAVAMLAGGPAVQAATEGPYTAACSLPQSEIHFSHLPLLGEFDGSQMPFARTDARYYPAGLGGLSLSAVSAALPIDFPVHGSHIRFFYVLDNLGKYNKSAPIRLVSCLYFTARGEAHVLSNLYGEEGNAVPVVTSLFSINVAHGIGRVLFVVLRSDIQNAVMSQTGYALHAYGEKDIFEAASMYDWSNFELSDFIAKVFRSSSWAVGEGETVQSVRAYTDKVSIVKRLRQLGYLK